MIGLLPYNLTIACGSGIPWQFTNWQVTYGLNLSATHTRTGLPRGDVYFMVGQGLQANFDGISASGYSGSGPILLREVGGTNTRMNVYCIPDFPGGTLNINVDPALFSERFLTGAIVVRKSGRANNPANPDGITSNGGSNTIRSVDIFSPQSPVLYIVFGYNGDAPMSLSGTIQDTFVSPAYSKQSGIMGIAQDLSGSALATLTNCRCAAAISYDI